MKVFSRVPTSSPHGLKLVPTISKKRPKNTSSLKFNAGLKCFDRKLILSNQKIQSLENQIIPSDILELDISQNPFDSFKGFPTLTQLVKLDFRNTHIANCANFPSLPHLEKIYLAGTPLSSKSGHRIALILLVPSLKYIDNQLITSSERELAKNYQPECINLIKTGWIPDFSPPSSSQLKILMEESVINRFKSSSKELPKSSRKSQKVSMKIIPIGAQLDSQIREQEELIVKLQEQLNIYL